MKMETIKKSAVVLESLRSLQFKIRLDDGKEIRAYLCGKMNKHRIKVLVGDRVIVELSPSISVINNVGRIISRL
jgi:translation initiation factor IF-1